jgi:hypothetical protein
MGEPERRRRRLRPPSSATAAAEAPATETPAAAPGGDPVSAPAVEDPSASVATTPTAEAAPIAETSAVEDPVAGASPALMADQAVVEAAAPRPTRAGFMGRLPRAPGLRPTSGAGVGGDDREAERGLRGLVGSGSSQVSVGAALRARDAARPTDAHLAEAEQNLAIVRRNWLPREDLPRNR